MNKRRLFTLIGLLLVGCVLVGGCEYGDFTSFDLYGPAPNLLPDPDPDPTPDPDPDPPEIQDPTYHGNLNVQEGDEEFCGNAYGERFSIAVDSEGQPHAIMDVPDSSRLFIYHKIGGVWSEGQFAMGRPGGKYDCSRLYMPHIEIDPKDRAWISCKMGCKEWGTMGGQALWCLDNITTTDREERFFKHVPGRRTALGNGNVSLDPSKPNQGIVLATGGNWARVDDSGSIVATGKINAGASGEKIRFRISPGGVWHTAMGGFSRQSSAYQNTIRNSQELVPVTWAGYRAYPEQGDDMKHPGIGIDAVNPQVAYIGIYYHPGLVINVWNGSNMVFDKRALPVIDGAASETHRYGPQWAPAIGGGAFLCWTRAGRIKLLFVGPNGAMEDPFPGQDDPRDVCAGEHGSIAVDSQGYVHLIYRHGGGVRYRKLAL